MQGNWGGMPAGLALAAGLGAGYLLWASESPIPERPEPSTPLLLPPEEPPEPSPGAEAAGESTAELRRYREELARLQKELAAARQKLQTAEGRQQDLEATVAEVTGPIPFPVDLPERFQQEPLRRALDAALEELDGEIVAMDCTEYPCIAFATLSQPAGQGLHTHFRKHPALAAYAEDSPISTHVAGRDEQGEPVSHSVFAFVPDSVETLKSEEKQRMFEHIQRRLRAWTSSLRSPETSAP